MAAVSPSAMGPHRETPMGEVVRSEPPGWSSSDNDSDEEEATEPGTPEPGPGDEPGLGYLPLAQDLDEEDGGGGGGGDGGVGFVGQTTQSPENIEQTLRDMGLYLPPPPADSEDEVDDAEAAGACSSQAINMDNEHVELVKKTMAMVKLPAVPGWAQELSDEQWKDMVSKTLQPRNNATEK
ncbi:male-enhanced antigen 1 [Lampetra fluviatilis]